MTLLSAFVLIGPSVIGGSFAPDYWTYAALRLVTCTAIPLVWINNSAIVMEAFSTKHRWEM